MNNLSRIKKDLFKILILAIIIFGSFFLIYFLDQKNNLLQDIANKFLG